MTPVFPFSAVVGHDTVKLALTLLAIDPRIGGLLVSGPRGSAKSTLARSMAGLENPQLKQMVTLPLGASEEMLTGALDLQQALQDQKVAFAPGLLSKAHQGLLYVDEVNLLPDSLVDLLLDVVESGVNYIERDGISHQHAAKFVLMGTMNPDEGELRPQLLDRFGFMVTLDHQFTPEQRVDIVRRRQAFDLDPQALLAEFAAPQAELSQQIAHAQALLTQVSIADAMRLIIAQRCTAAQVDGLRADLVWVKAASAHAAWRGATQVDEVDIDSVEALVLAHRRQSPAQQGGPDDNAPTNQSTPQSSPFKRPADTQLSQQHDHSSGAQQQTSQQPELDQDAAWGQMPTQIQATQSQANMQIPAPLTSPAYSAPAIQKLTQPSQGRLASGKGKTTHTNSQKIHWFASLVAGRGKGVTLRYKPERGADPCMHLLMLDTSASTLQHQAQSQAKGMVANIVHKAYLKRQQLLLLGFGNDRVDILLAHGRAPKVIKPLLNTVGAGGGTPLQQALKQARVIARQWLIRYPAVQIINYLISDGRVQTPLAAAPLMGKSVFIDIEQSAIKRGRGQHIAQQLDAEYFTIGQLVSLP